MVTILVLYFNDYDIHGNTLFRAVKNGFTVKVKNTYIQVSCQVQNAVDLTRLALFHFSVGQSPLSLDPQNEIHKAS